MRWDEATKASTRTSGPGPATSASARATIGTFTSVGLSSWRPRAGRRSQYHGGTATAKCWRASRRQPGGGDSASGGSLAIQQHLKNVRRHAKPRALQYGPLVGLSVHMLPRTSRVLLLLQPLDCGGVIAVSQVGGLHHHDER